MVVTGGIVRTGSWARSASVLSFGFGCHALHVCFRVGRPDPACHGMATKSLTKALASSYTQPTHLKILSEAGLASGERREKWVWYSLNRDRRAASDS